MGFFKEIKDDISQAVNELVPDEMFDDNQVVNTLEDTDNETAVTTKENESVDTMNDLAFDSDLINEIEETVDNDIVNAILTQEDNTTDVKKEEKGKPDKKVKKEEILDTDPNKSDDITVITKGTTINGSISSDGSLEIMGTIKGDVECQGKLSIFGTVAGNCMASEVFVGAKRLEGSINSEGNVKIGLGTVIIGDVTASAGVIAGAVKGEIDINGPVVVDSSAVIKGNIKAQSIQINNGAVIEGFCSLSYAAIDIDNIFE